MRLTTFDDVEFFVGICHEGEYLDVCGDQWDAYDATIACRLAGFDQCKKTCLSTPIFLCTLLVLYRLGSYPTVWL